MPTPFRTPARRIRKAAPASHRFSPASERLEARALLSGPGSLDTTFGTGGLATADFTAGSDQATDVAVRADGKIVVVGQTSGQTAFAAARFNADGSPDTSFGTGGKVTTAFAGTTLAWAKGVVVQPDGNTVVAGSDQRTVVITSGKNRGTYTYYDYALARYTAGGALDPTFGSGGKVTTSFGPTQSGYADAVVLQTDGKIVVAGDSNASGPTTFTLVRYNPDGSLDTTFGSGGKVTTAISFYSSIKDIALQADGKVVAVGFSDTVYSQAGQVLTVARYNTNGSLDSTFGSGGVASVPNPPSSTGYPDRSTRAVALQGDGKIIATAVYSAGSQFDVVRFNTNGSLDSTFGTGGEVLTTFPAYNNSRVLNDVAVQGDGKIVVGGYYTAPLPYANGPNPVAVRYNPDGSLDATFGNGGIATASHYNAVGGVAIQPTTGRILLAGRNDANGGQFAVTGFVGEGTTTLLSASRSAPASTPTRGAMMVAFDAPLMFVPPVPSGPAALDWTFVPGLLSPRKRPRHGP